MKFSINTAKINSALSKVQKGVGGSKIMPITEYLSIKLQDGTLSITATDLNNFITYTGKDIEGEDGEVIVKADALIKLVSKTTKSEMTFKSTDTHLEVKGNGTYKIPLFEDNDFPTYEFNHDVKQYEVETAKLKKMLNTNAGAIAKEMIMPCLTGYKIEENRAITTDGIKMCINNVQIADADMLITQKFAELVHTLVDDKVTVQKDDNKVLLTTDSLTIFGAELDGIEEFPDITGILDLEHEGKVVVNKNEMLNALDRLSIFVDPFDNNGVVITFTENLVQITDMKENSSETLEHEDADVKADVQITVNLQFLKDLLSVLSESSVQMQFGQDLPLKIVEGDVSQILSTMSTEE